MTLRRDLQYAVPEQTLALVLAPHNADHDLSHSRGGDEWEKDCVGGVDCFAADRPSYA